MIKLSIFYPYHEGCKFDMDYYCKTHLGTLAQSKFGAALKGASAESGINAGAPGTKPLYAAVGHLLFESLEVFGAVFPAAAPELGADVVNYTDITPVVQISQVAM